MTYTAAIRQYITEHQEELFDADYVRTQYFPTIEIKTFLKILDRLETEGLIKKISRGVYAPPRLLKDIPNNPEALTNLVHNHYMNGTDGMALGYVNYTNRLSAGKTKTVCGVVLTGVDLSFDEPTRQIVLLLELLENHRKMHGYSIEQYYLDQAKLAHSLSGVYSDALMQEILSSIRYQFGTVSNFCRLLDEVSIPHAPASKLVPIR